MRGRRALASLAALGVALVAGGCTSSNNHATNTTTAPAVSFTKADLSHLVLQIADAPPDSQEVKSTTGPENLAQLVSGDKSASAEQRALRRDQFLGSYATAYISPEVPASGGASQIRFATSLAALFPNGASAAQALAYLVTLATTGNVTHFDASSLGTGAIGLESSTSTVIGNDYAMFWRNGNTVLIVIVATDSSSKNPADALSIADTVALRASTSSLVAVGDLSRIVLQASEAPPGTEFLASRSGSKSATQLSGQRAEAAELTKLGYLGGFQTVFAAGSLTNAGHGQTGATYIASFAQAYRNANGAKSAYELQISGRLRLLGNGLRTVSPGPLGDQAKGFSFTTSQGSTKLPGVLLAWRRSNVVFALFEFGPPGSVSVGAVRAMAQKIDARAGRMTK